MRAYIDELCLELHNLLGCSSSPRAIIYRIHNNKLLDSRIVYCLATIFHIYAIPVVLAIGRPQTWLLFISMYCAYCFIVLLDSYGLMLLSSHHNDMTIYSSCYHYYHAIYTNIIKYIICNITFRRVPHACLMSCVWNYIIFWVVIQNVHHHV